MTKLTSDSLVEFFDYVANNPNPEFDNDCGDRIFEINEKLRPIMDKLVMLYVLRIMIDTPGNVITSCFLSGFQMGRYYNQREHEMTALEDMAK